RTGTDPGRTDAAGLRVGGRHVRHHPRRPAGPWLGVLACVVGTMAVLPGCIKETSFRMHLSDRVAVQPAPGVSRGPASTRGWLATAHQQLKALLPANSRA